MAANRQRDAIDVRGMVIPLWMAISIVFTGLGIAFATGAFYWNVSTSLASLVAKVDVLTSTALTQADLENFCLKAEVLNQKKGWQCPFGRAEVSVALPPVQRVLQRATALQ